MRSKPRLNPLNCQETTPKVAFVTVEDLPTRLQVGLTRVPSPELGLSPARPFQPTDTMLLYVPAPNEHGFRTIRLDGGPYVDLNPWCSTSFGNSRSSEICAPQQLNTRIGSLLYQNQDGPSYNIDLAQTSISADTTGNGRPLPHSFRGIIIVANEIQLSGHVKTLGNDLVLLAETITGAADTVLDVGQARMSYDTTQGQPTHAGRLLLFAKQMNFARQGEMRAQFLAGGGFGSFPKATKQEWNTVLRQYETTYQHPDCSNDATIPGATRSCYQCLYGKFGCANDYHYEVAEGMRFCSTIEGSGDPGFSNVIGINSPTPSGVNGGDGGAIVETLPVGASKPDVQRYVLEGLGSDA